MENEIETDLTKESSLWKEIMRRKNLEGNVEEPIINETVWNYQIYNLQGNKEEGNDEVIVTKNGYAQNDENAEVIDLESMLKSYEKDLDRRNGIGF